MIWKSCVPPEVAIPVFGYKTDIVINRTFGRIRNWAVTSTARHDGVTLSEIATINNTGFHIWADSAYRSKTSEKWLRAAVWSAGSIARNRPGGRCPSASGAATQRNRRRAGEGRSRQHRLRHGSPDLQRTAYRDRVAVYRIW